MAEHDYSDATTILEQIEAVLPDEKVKALSVLLTASAIKAVDGGISDARAVSGLIASLETVRSQLNKTRPH